MTPRESLRLKVCAAVVAMLAVCGSARADSLSGVVVGEDGAPIVSAALTLTQGKASRQGATDNAGAFRFADCKQGAAAVLTVAKAGYETLKYELTAISGDVSLDTIVMARTSVKLGEAKVVARTTTIEGNRRIIYLTKKQRERYADGASLLNTLKLPGLTVIPASKEVHYWGKGDLKYYINDFPADIAKVRALLPRDIVRVEYIEHPGPEFGVGTGLVLRFITKRYERGASVVATLDKAINRNLGNYSVESRISHKNSEFALSYNGDYDNSNHHKNQFQTAETFRLPAGEQLRSERERYNKGKHFNNSLGAAWYYTKPGKRDFSLQLGYSDYNRPGMRQVSTLYNAGLRTDTTEKFLDRKGNRQTFAGSTYFHQKITDAKSISFRGSYYYGMNSSRSAYDEHNASGTLNAFHTDIDGHSQGFSAMTWYNDRFTKNWFWMAALSDSYSHTSNRYSGSYAGRPTGTTNSAVLQLSTTFYGGKRRQYSQTVSTSLADRYSKVNGYSADHHLLPDINSDARYTFKGGSYVGLGGSLSASRPSTTKMSTAVQRIDEIQVRTGNQHLRSGFNADISPEWRVVFTKRYSMQGWVAYYYNRNSVREGTLLDDGLVVRRPSNFNIHYVKSELSFNANFTDWLSASWAVGYNKFWSHDRTLGRNYVYDKPYTRLDVTAELGRWDLNLEWWTHNNDFAGECLYTSGRNVEITAQRTWIKGHLLTALHVYAPFSRNYQKEGVVCRSNIAPYSNWTHYYGTYRRLDLTLSWNFTVGRKTSNKRIAPRNNVSTGTINDSKSSTME